ncbi:MAG: OmpA family protein [Deltaproteobacteria bacterium]|nr:OmpA family protein [Deltaproteobacteria bacterium]
MKKICICLVVVIAAFVSWQPVFAQTATMWIERGDTLEERGIHIEAVKAYTKAIEYDPGCAVAYLKRGTALFSERKSNCTESHADLTAAIKLAPENADAYYQRGIVNYYMINNEQGRSDMETAAALGHKGAMKWLASKTETKQAEVTPLSVKPIVYFDHDKSDIKPFYHKLLEEIGTALTERSSRVSIMLSGHADSTGTKKYNNALSLERATAVKEYLVKNFNISSGRIAVTAYGEGMPVTSNSTLKGRALNRRVEITGIETTNDISGD